MTYYPYLQSKRGKWLFGVFLFVLLYITRNTMTASSLIGIQKAQFLTLGLVAMLGIGFLWTNRKQWKQILTDKRILLMLVCALLILLPMLLKRDWQMMYISILLCVLYGIFLTFFIDLRELAKCYVVILTVVGVYSILAAYGLRLLADREICPIPIIYNPAHIRFYFLGTYVPLNYVKMRNFGLFREPGVYQYFLTLALILNNYVVSWKKERSLWVCNVLLAVTMLTTMATGGVAGLGLLVIVVFFERKLYRDKRIIALALVLLLLLALAVGLIVMEKGELYWELYSMVYGKIFNEEKNSTERVDAIVSDFRFFLDDPLVGGKIADVLDAVENNTTSTMLMLAFFGIAGGLLHMGSWLALVWSGKRKIWVNIILVLIAFLSFNTQNLIADPFFWLMPMMALTEKVIPKLKKKE